MKGKSAIKSERLNTLEMRLQALQKKIAKETRRLRDQNRQRAGVRARVIGETVLELSQQGLLTEAVIKKISMAALARVEGNSVELEALQGSPFDPTLLLENSEVADSDKVGMVATGSGEADGSE
jgi:hypothetical protein